MLPFFCNLRLSLAHVFQSKPRCSGVRWDGVAAQARDLAQRLNRSDLAVRWGALSQAPPR